MKTTRQMFAGFFGLLIALTFVVTPLQPSFAQSSHPAAVQQQQFNGPLLYKDAFEKLKRFHIDLVDPKVRDEWSKEWENKFRGKLTSEEKTDAAIREMMHSLTRLHDHYLTPAQKEAQMKSFKPGFAGVGIGVGIKGRLELLKALPDNPTADQIAEANSIDNDKRPFVVIDEPMDGLPAQKAGLQQGDAILAVKEATSTEPAVSLHGKTSNQAVELIRGKIDTEVVLTIRRDDGNGGTKEFDVTIKRAKVVPKVTKVKDLGDGVTYVRLFDFSSENAEKEMSDALKEAAKGKALVLDLRGNPGGRLGAAKSITAKILETGTIVVEKKRIEGGDGFEIETTSLLKKHGIVEYEDTTNPRNNGLVRIQRATMIIPKDMPVVVLINGGSASASEIVSGALKYNGRATIVGKGTFGKGVGQTVLPLAFKRGLDVTTFEFMPADQPMNLVGVLPDIEVDQPEEDRWDANKDTQLDAAKKAALDLLAEADALKKKRDAIGTQKLEDWKKATEAQKKQP